MPRVIMCTECQEEKENWAKELCRTCYARLWYRQNPRSREKNKEMNNLRTAKNYGLTPEEYKVIVKLPCCICGDTAKRKVMDHSHKFGHTRGPLCSRCNILVGMLECYHALLPKAFDYILICETSRKGWFDDGERAEDITSRLGVDTERTG